MLVLADFMVDEEVWQVELDMVFGVFCDGEIKAGLTMIW